MIKQKGQSKSTYSLIRNLTLRNGEEASKKEEAAQRSVFRTSAQPLLMFFEQTFDQATGVVAAAGR